MPANLFKKDLLAIFEEVEQEQKKYFQLTDRFIKKIFKAQVIEQAKQYIKNEQINWLQYNDDFSVIDATIMSNEGNTYSQHIEITKLPTGFSIDSHCTCNSKAKCRHIAAILLKLKVEHSGDYGEDYFINDWFTELNVIKNPSNTQSKQVILFVLDIEQSKVVLNCKIATYNNQQQYSLGKSLTEQQLNSFVTPGNLSESDFRLFTWIRSQNSLGGLHLFGEWGFSALQQLIATQRLFFQRSRQPISANDAKDLLFKWQNNKELTQLNLELSTVKNWALINTVPPTYLDYDNFKIGRIRAPLSGDEINHLQSIPAIHDSNFDRIYKQLADNFGPELIPHPKNLNINLNDSTPIIVNAFSEHNQLNIELTLKYDKKQYKLNTAPTNIINLALENTITNQLINLGFSLCKPPLQNRFFIDKQSVIYEHWFEHELVPRFIKRGWVIKLKNISTAISQSNIKIALKRGVGHQVIGKVIIDNSKALAILSGENVQCQSLNRQSELFHYYPLEKKNEFGVVSKAAYDELKRLHDEFEVVKNRDELIFPLSYLKSLLSLKAIDCYSIDNGLDQYYQELQHYPQQGFEVESGLYPNIQLRDYQKQGVAWLHFLKRHHLGGILADDMGLGKTLQVIAFLAQQAQQPQSGISIIICPTSLVGNWQNEIIKFTKALKVTTIFGNARFEQLNELSKAKCIITTYPLLKRDIKHYAPLYFDNIILDEAQYIKNQNAQVSRYVKRLNADFKLCLSGTPIENNLLELKSLLDFAMPKLLGSASHFKSHFQIPIEKDANEQRAEQLKSLILPFILRRTKSQVVKELPQKTELIKEFEFGDKQLEMYADIAQSLESKLVNLFAEQGVKKSKLAFLEALLKLRQVCCHPKLIDSGSKAHSAKLEWLSQNLPTMLKANRRVIIFSQFTKALDLIAKRLNKLNINFSLLTGQTRQRDRVIESFTSGKTSVFLISLKAGGIGLNLTQADTVIHFDPWWNPAVEKQATDRAYRIGQTNPVFVYKLMMNNSIEQKVFHMQQQKQALVDVLFTEKSLDFNEFDEQQMLSLIKN